MKRPALLAAFALAASFACTCTERPDPPGRSNPFDPGGPAGGDPFALTARLTGAVVDLDWNDVPLPGNLGYTVYRGRDAATVLSNPDTILVVGHDSSGFRDESPRHGASSAYVVTIRNAQGVESVRSDAAPVSLALPQHIEIRTSADERSFLTDSRHVKVRVTAEGATGVLLSNAVAEGDLVDPDSFPYAAASIEWELTRNPPDTTFFRIVHARILYGDDSVSAVIADTILTRVPPLQIRVEGVADSTALAGRRSVTVSLRLTATSSLPPPSADSVEISLSRPFADAFQPFPDSASGYSVEALLERPALDTLYARVKNDLGHIGIDSLPVRADSLAGGAILLNNSVFPSEAASTRRDRVNVHVTGVNATSICLSNDPIPPCFGFAPLDTAGRIEWMLDGPADRDAVVYAILANEWRPEGAGVLFDSIRVEGDSLRVRITSPAELEAMLGDTLTIAGFARRRTFGPAIAEIELFAGGKALALETTPATGADTVDVKWSAFWTIPDSMAADTTGGAQPGSILARVRDESGDVATDSLLLNLSAPAGSRRASAAPRARARAR